MKLNIEWKMNVPNALSILRLIMIPIFAVLYLPSGDNLALRYSSFGVLILSGVTDSLDGMIARRFHQVTDLGKILDPLADKLTQVTVVICLACTYPELIPIGIICFVKEALQAIGGVLLLRDGRKVEGAKWFGKISTFTFYGVMAAILLFPRMIFPVRVGLIALAAVTMLFAFGKYIHLFLHVRKEDPAKSGKFSSDQSGSCQENSAG